MPSSITINSDLGESFGLHSFGHDNALIDLISAANVACGFHAGDPHVMAATVADAVRAGVAVGAHPGLPDLIGFGRRPMALTPDEVRDLVTYQVGALTAFVTAAGAELSHIKVHGALYGMLARDADLMRPVAELAARLGVSIFGIAGSAHQSEAVAAGADFVGELYVDLDYAPDGSLVIERRPKETDLVAAAARVRSAVTTGTIASTTGSSIPMQFSSVCVHSDTPNCVDVARAVATELQSLAESAPSEQRQTVGNA